MFDVHCRFAAVKRLMREAQELHEATEEYFAQPLEVRKCLACGSFEARLYAESARVDCRIICLSGTSLCVGRRSRNLKEASTMAA